MSGRGSQSTRAALAQAEQLIEVRRPHDAVRIATEALARDPDHAGLGATIGWAILTAGDPITARAWLEWSLARDPQSGWVHHLRACALLDGAGAMHEAREAAERAVATNPYDEVFLYTLLQASLECRDRARAEEAAAAIRRVAPRSERGPLAEALIELDRGGAYRRRAWSTGAMVAAVLVTRGAALVVLGVWWVVQVVRRAPHLRRADELIEEALTLRPDAAWVRTLAAEVLRKRFRFAQAVDHEVAAAVFDAGLVDARRLARSVTGRNAGLIGALGLAWILLVSLVDAAVASDVAVAVLGVALTVAGEVGVAWFDRWQTRSLPRPLRRSVRATWLPALVAAAVGMFLVLVGSQHDTPDAPAPGYALAGLVSAPLVLAGAALLTGLAVFARRL